MNFTEGEVKLDYQQPVIATDTGGPLSMTTTTTKGSDSTLTKKEQRQTQQ